MQFLTHLGISKVEDLPEYEHFKNILERFETQAQESQAAENPIPAIVGNMELPAQNNDSAIERSAEAAEAPEVVETEMPPKVEDPDPTA